MAAKQPQARPRHVPQRTCIACRRVEAKRGLVRVVRSTTGAVQVDTTGKVAGRGAYLCAEQPCWAQALKRGALERALRTELSNEDRAALASYAQQLPDANESPEAAMA